MKKSLIILALFFIFSLIGNIKQASASYTYESIAFYGKISPSSYSREGIAFYSYSTQAAGTLPVYRFINTNTGDHFFTISENEKNNLINNPSFGYKLEGAGFYANSSQAPDTYPIYRFRHSISGDHFYTANENEKNTLLNNPQWNYILEGTGFYANKTQINETLPVYRFYNASNGDHFYTISENEKNSISQVPIYRFINRNNGDHFYTASTKEKDGLIANPQWGYAFEGIAFYEQISQVDGTLPVYRFYKSSTGDHFYTISESEKNSLQSNPQHGYQYEGIGFYGYPTQSTGTYPVYRFYNATNGDHFYTIFEAEKNYLQKSELGPEISVGLWNYSTSSIKDTPFKISANKNYIIKNADGAVIGNVPGSTDTRVSYDKDSYLKIYESISSAKSKKVAYFEAADGDNAGIIFDVNRPDSSYDQYRGKIAVRYTDSGNIWVINTLPLEHYTWGMGETTGTGPDEHTKLMTTIFRTYGKWYIDYATKYAIYGFKIRSDSGSQIYRGYDWETRYANIKKNAQTTRGVIATYGSETALTPYSSWSDGRTRSFKERWGSSEYPWCKSVSDPYGKHPSKSTSTLEAEGNHMVGLIANGSLNLADDHNWDYQRIMKYYYSGISLNTNY